jgi:hypothetical protein
MPFDDGRDPLEALKAELASVGPSQAFAAGVRQRLDAEPERSTGRFPISWRWAVPVGVATAAVVWTLVVQRRPEPRQPQTVVATAGPGVTATTPPVAPAAAAPTVTAPGAPGASVREPVRAPRRPATQMTAAAIAEQPAEPTLEVITNQPAILRALWTAVAAEHAVVVPAASPFVEPSADIVVAPVEVRPVVVKWMVEPPAGAGGEGGSPIIRRMAADTAARSDQ